MDDQKINRRQIIGGLALTAGTAGLLQALGSRDATAGPHTTMGVITRPQRSPPSKPAAWRASTSAGIRPALCLVNSSASRVSISDRPAVDGRPVANGARRARRIDARRSTLLVGIAPPSPGPQPVVVATGPGTAEWAFEWTGIALASAGRAMSGCRQGAAPSGPPRRLPWPSPCARPATG